MPAAPAFMTDVGMTGDYDSVIGMVKEEPVRRFLRKLPGARMEPATGPATLCAVAVETGGERPRREDRAGAHRRPAFAGAAGFLVAGGRGRPARKRRAQSSRGAPNLNKRLQAHKSVARAAIRRATGGEMAKAFASQGDMAAKKISFVEIGPGV